MPSPKPVQKIIISEDLKQKWDLVSPNDYPLITAAYIELLTEQNKKIYATLNSIKQWVEFFGVIAVIALIMGGCTAMSLFLK